MLNLLALIDRGIERTASFLLVVVVGLMLLLSVFTILLRWFEIGPMWADPLIRHLVFISIFLGGVLATGRRTHIGIDVLPRMLEQKKNYRLLGLIQRLIALVCTVTLIWLAKAGYDFSLIEMQYGKEAFLGIHSGFLVSIIPVGLIFISYRFFFLLFAGSDSRLQVEESKGSVVTGEQT
ncbi:MAG: TRAP transporter small permease [Bdellovibrionales bacterium]|jgi:TRAP-type C4-dicarboxylate transport system permease small subunit|nr:TRAP transporter small permease [Bdellovibrionales bacterium]MBT3526535.1 TRAP transporter small permease [Bdellovibrionales bacterium]MBT7669483.1 TRAP transporter small permease [Bdellovibrionales bacterium]MBT7767554.1 TRAP transporter small permease [Bdellovibrionales bacterium]